MNPFIFPPSFKDPQQTFIIAEIGVNHNGSIEMAKQMIDEAKNAGANAVKFQTFKAEMLVTDDAPKAEYQKETDGTQRSQKEMLKALELTSTDFKELKTYCDQVGIEFISSPFDVESARFLQSLNVNVIKIPSGEITNAFLLETLHEIHKPVILSTGMATIQEIQNAITILNLPSDHISILHCVSCYPTTLDNFNLKRMLLFKATFPGHVIGFSDHTTDIIAPIIAVSHGAKIIEKHFTLDKSLPGPDHRASLTPTEFKQMVEGIRAIEKVLTVPEHNVPEPRECEKDVAIAARKSIVAKKDLPQGHVIQKQDLMAKRPGTGVPPTRYLDFIGKTLNKPIQKNQQITYKDIT